MNQERLCFAVAREPTGELYRAIIEDALWRCDRFTLVQRRECNVDESAKIIWSNLSPHLLREQNVSEWPGTKLLGGEATLREYKLSEATAAVLAEAVEGLYGWCQPRRPEDPVFWRKASGPWLVTIAHERDAYFEATADEFEEILRVIPSLSTVMELR